MFLPFDYHREGVAVPQFRVKGYPELTEDAGCREMLQDAHRKGELLSASKVAKLLGIPERTLRTWIADGTFLPAPVETISRKDFWPIVVVLGFQASRIASGHPISSRSPLKTNDQIDEADENRFEALDDERADVERKVHKLAELFAEDKVELAKRHPNLKRWLKDYKKPVSHWKHLASKEN